MDWKTFLITLFSSGVLAAIIGTITQKRSEKETRLFNAKLEAYKNFITLLMGLYDMKVTDIGELEKISAPALLVSGKNINEKIHHLNILISTAYKAREELHKINISPSDSSNSQARVFKGMIDKIVDLRSELEGLMRKDLGFK